jgi:hypothetical protein
MINHDRVKQLLGSGLNPTVVSEAVGCSVSYISQLLAEENFAREVSELRTKDLIKYQEIDGKYDTLEEKLLKKLEDLMPFFTKPRDVIAALQMVNSAKRKSVGPGAKALESGAVVNLILPNVILNHYKVNIHGAMVEVGGRDLTPMPSRQLLKTLEERMGAHETPKLPAEITHENVPRENVINDQAV